MVPVAGGVPSTQSAGDELLADFGRYLRQQRGLSPATVRAYQRYSRSCVRAWWPDGIAAPAELRASDVISVVRSSAVAMPPASLRCMVTALRALLRFFHATGRTSGRWPGPFRRWRAGGRLPRPPARPRRDVQAAGQLRRGYRHRSA